MMIPGERVPAEQAGGRPAEPGGHKLLCPKCEEFRVHKASPDPDGAIRLECYTCHTSDRFVMRAGLYMYEPFDRSLGVWVDEYTVHIKHVGDDGMCDVLGCKFRTEAEEQVKPRRGVFKRKDPAPKPAPETSVKAEAEKPNVAKDPLAGFDFSVIKTFADALAVADGDYETAADLLRRAKEARAK